MLLPTQVLLLLFVSSGMCATLGYYQAAETEEATAEDPAAALTETDDGEAAAADARVLPSAGAAAVGSSVEGKQLADVPGSDEPAGEEPKVDVQVVDGEAAKESEAEQDGDPRAEEVLPGGEVHQEHASPEEEASNIETVQTTATTIRPGAEEADNSWSLSSIRRSFQTAHGYFDSLVELVGGHNGVCQYRCRHGELPQPRPGYQLPEPNGCSSSLVGFQLDLGIPAMTKCCDHLDTCYDTCGTSKYDCDSKFRLCMHDICSDLKKSLGFESKVQACESMADALYNTVWTLGCRPYMNSQRAACVCSEEERDEL